MIQAFPSKHGRPGDMVLMTPPAPLAYSALEKPDTSFMGQGVYSLGIQLADDDMRATATAMREAFRTAFPAATGKIKLPIRQNRSGVWVLYAETMKVPTVLNVADKPVPPPPLGSLVRLLARICPFQRNEIGRQGVALYVNKIKLPPSDVRS